MRVRRLRTGNLCVEVERPRRQVAVVSKKGRVLWWDMATDYESIERAVGMGALDWGNY